MHARAGVHAHADACACASYSPCTICCIHDSQHPSRTCVACQEPSHLTEGLCQLLFVTSLSIPVVSLTSLWFVGAGLRAGRKPFDKPWTLGLMPEGSALSLCAILPSALVPCALVPCALVPWVGWPVALPRQRLLPLPVACAGHSARAKAGKWWC